MYIEHCCQGSFSKLGGLWKLNSSMLIYCMTVNMRHWCDHLLLKYSSCLVIQTRIITSFESVKGLHLFEYTHNNNKMFCAVK